MSEYKVDTRDIQFVLHEYLKITDLARFEAFEEFDRETYDMMLDMAVKFAVEQLGPINGVLDEKGVQWEAGKVTLPEEHKAAYELFCEGGWVGTASDPEYGGQGLPWTFDTIIGEIFSGGCMSLLMTPGLTKSAASLIVDFGTDELKDVYAENMISGEWGGTMCLTEPQAGSDVGATKSTAKPVEGEDYYLIEGTKIFISSGEHDLTENIVHLVLARLPGAVAGVKGLSLFVVPKLRPTDDDELEGNDVFCSGVEHKMGIHGSPTCTLNFGDNGECRGWLLGEPGQGIKIMFHMMNEARIFVGVQSMALANAAYQAAVAYAQERLQGSDLKNFKDPEAPKVPIINQPDIRLHLMHMRVMAEGLRALAVKTGMYADIAHHAEGKKAEKARYCLEVLTPIVKAFSSDQAFRVTERAVQVLGGYGFCTEYGVEQYVRDAKICSIYEGANGIQALDLVGRKISMKGGAAFMTLLLEINRFIGKNKKDELLGDLVKDLEKVKNTLAGVTLDFGKKFKKDPLYPIMAATPYLEMFGRLVVGWVLLEQAAVAKAGLARLDEAGAGEDHPDRAFYGRKIDNARFYIARELPLGAALAGVIRSNDKSPIVTTF